MSKEEWINWLKARPEYPAEWDIEDCIKANEFIKEHTLENFGMKVDNWDLPDVVKEWLKLSVSVHVGSVEVDKMMMELRCYP